MSKKNNAIKAKVLVIFLITFILISFLITSYAIYNKQIEKSRLQTENELYELKKYQTNEEQLSELSNIIFDKVKKERKKTDLIYLIILSVVVVITIFLIFILIKNIHDSPKNNEDDKKYKILVENLNNVIFSLDEKEAFTYISPSLEKLLKFHPGEFIGQHFSSMVYAEDKELAVNTLMDFMNNVPIACIIELRMQKKSGKFIWVNVEFRRILNKGKVSGFQGVISDITKAKLADEKIKEANEKIMHQQKSITDSIMYARKIQRAVLPQPDYIEKCFPKYFVLYRPKDIVSGDFYWITRKAATIMIAVADCTGHGVPGAFMSLLGMSFLNDVLRKNMKSFFESKLKASDMLENLRKTLKKALRQASFKTTETKDGIDMAFCIIDLDTNYLQFAGAYNPLIIIRDKEIIKLKANKNPIGIYIREEPFTNHEMQLKPGDMLYMFTDGYLDQLGGDKKYKFMIKNFENLLLDIHQKPMDEQKQILKETFAGWKGNYPQVDDILVFGFMIE